MRSSLRLTSMVLAGAVSLANAAHGKDRQRFNLDQEHVRGELIIRRDVGVLGVASAQSDLMAQLGLRTKYRFRSGAEVVRLTQARSDADLLRVAKILAATPGVRSVEANTILRIVRAPNDPEFPRLYGLHNEGAAEGKVDADIDATEAWDITTGSRDVLVGVIDTGVDYTHPDLQSNYWASPGESGVDAQGADKRTNGIDDDNNGFVDDWRGWDFVNNDNDPMDDHGHGTHVSGTIGAAGDDGQGVVGVNWAVSIVGIKFLSGSGSGTLEDAVKAIEYGTTLGVRLTSNSWGGGGYSDTMADAIRLANQRGILFIAAAGNDAADNDESPHFPSSYTHDNVIAVAATDRLDKLADFSCWGKLSVDLSAPGVDILSTVLHGNHEEYSGTSMATPHVSGVVALIMARYPEASLADVRNRVLYSVDLVDGLADKVLTGGRLNAARSLEPDEISPDSVADLGVVGEGTLDSVKLGWSAVGDDGAEGRASAYEIRWALSPITTETEWSQATSGGMVSGGRPTGSAMEFVLGALPVNVEGFASVRAIDNVGHISSLGDSVPFAVRKVHVAAQIDGSSLEGATIQGAWGLETIDDSHTVFSDSVGGSYADNANSTLALAPIVMDAPVAGAMLVVTSKFDLERGFDFGHVEVMSVAGAWVPLDKVSGQSSDWETRKYALGSDVALPLQVQFRTTSDGSIVADGWRIDHVEVWMP